MHFHESLSAVEVHALARGRGQRISDSERLDSSDNRPGLGRKRAVKIPAHSSENRRAQ